MRQFLQARCRGIVGKVIDDPAKGQLLLLVLINKADKYNSQIGQDKVYVRYFDGAYKALIPYVRAGDTILIEEMELNIDYEKKTVYLNVRHPSQTHVTPSEASDVMRFRKLEHGTNIPS